MSSPLSQLYRTLSSSATHGEGREEKGEEGRRKEGRGGEEGRGGKGRGVKKTQIKASWNEGNTIFKFLCAI